MKKITIIVSESSGGVKTIINKLIIGLRREGFSVIRINLHGKNRIVRAFEDLKNIKFLRHFDTVIYTGSIPYPSCWFIKGLTKILIFLHGFVVYEIMSVLNDPCAPLRTKIKSLYLLQSWNLNRLLGCADLYICHSLTTCEMNGIDEDFILLPQFIFPEETESYSKLCSILTKDGGFSYNEVKIVTYTSAAPRFLEPYYIIKLMISISKRVPSKKIQLLVIDPRAKEGQEEYDNLKVKFIKPLPRHRFLQLLAQADLYLERCIDEELGLTSIEAVLLGIPVAKLTHPKYVERQDYKDEVLWASSPQKFIDMLSDYVRHLDYWKSYYAKKLQNFLTTRRSWDYVKIPLLKYISLDPS
jgi:hypothetical protein